MALESLKRDGKRPAQLKASKEYPKRAVGILNTWFEENSEVLYPDRSVKEMLAEKAGLTSQQVKQSVLKRLLKNDSFDLYILTTVLVRSVIGSTSSGLK
jgi:hypothetical protein